MGSLLLALAPTVMAAQVYKWVDAQGVTHFGAQPPEGTSAATVNTNTTQPKSNFPPPPPPKPAPPASGTDDKQKALDDKVRQEVANQDAAQAQRCSQARENLAQLKNNPRVRVQENGEYRRITEEERQQRISDSEKAIRESCN
ncbi:hypothetical protein H681_20875 [Pseudomonas sp. ATCC 13867]|nr:hypothetical protein H681_20875 [Pseudomonas sp. ATCC 13867]